MPHIKRAALLLLLTLIGYSSTLLAQRPPSDASMVRVPRVTNLNINEARQRLQSDFDLKTQPVVVTSELRVGTVIEQQPVEGTLVKRGSVVRLQVSAGREGPELIEVPNVVGMSFDRAKSRLARFAVERVAAPRAERSNVPEGQVIQQSLRAASRAAVGSVIVLTVASPSRAVVEVFEMPNVVGRAYADAVRALAEFKVSRSDVDSSEPRDRIVAQTPVAGATLVPGSAVSLQVSAGPSSSKASTVDQSAAVTPGVSGNAVAKAEAKTEAKSEEINDTLAIVGAIAVGLILGALLMRQWLLRQRAVAAADDAITSMSPAPPVITTVDILLDAEPSAAESSNARDFEIEPPPESPQPQADLGTTDEQEKHPGP